jgi:hypothetical protein
MADFNVYGGMKKKEDEEEKPAVDKAANPFGGLVNRKSKEDIQRDAQNAGLPPKK